MCNYWSNRLCCEAADRAMQVHGGMGYSRHKPFEHIYRHHRRYRITEGSEEIQMRRVAGYLFGFMKQQAPEGGHRGERSAMTQWPERNVVDTITATDDEIRQAVSEAEVPPLLPALAYLTGDLSLLRDDLRPDPLLLGMEQGGLTEDQLATARALAVDTLIKYRDGGSTPAPVPGDDVLLRIMEYAVGGADMAAYLPLLEEELAYRGEDRRAPAWHVPEADIDFNVVIIGAGMSGLLAAHRLQQAGVSFVILEKDRDVGGTWWENRYPGCRVDNPNHNYSYSFAQRHDWPFHFSTQDVLHEYFRTCADAFGLREHIRFETEVGRPTWDDDNDRWTRARARPPTAPRRRSKPTRS